MVALGFLLLLGRAAYVQIVATDFYLAQGERRFVHTYDVPASRGRIVDRNGLILATSVATSTVYANRQNFKATPAQKKDLLRLLGMTPAEFDERLAQDLTDVSDQAPGARCAVAAGARARHQGPARHARLHAQLPRGRSGGARGGLHRPEGAGARRRGAGVPETTSRAVTASAASCATVSDAWSTTTSMRSTPRRAARCNCRSTPRCSSSPTSACAMRWRCTRQRPAAWW